MNVVVVKVFGFKFYLNISSVHMQNHFDLFYLPSQFEVDMTRLDRAFHEVQSQVHPDKFVHASKAEQRVAMQWATRANEAYQTLKDPLKRASYLCELHGVDLQKESSAAIPTTFLVQQLEWREELDESKQNSDALFRLQTKVSQAHEQYIIKIAEKLAESNYHQAAQSIQQLMFLEKFSKDIANARKND